MLAPFAFHAFSDALNSCIVLGRTSHARILATVLTELGFLAYLLAGSVPSLPADLATLIDTLLGATSILAYILFQSLSSTQHDFIRLSADEPADVRPDAIFVNLVTSILAILGVLLELATGLLLPSLDILFLDSALQLGVGALVLSSAALRVAFDATPDVERVSSIARFAQIGVNGVVFGTWTEMVPSAWCGIGWVASGAWIASEEREPAADDGGEGYDLVMAEAGRTSSASASDDEQVALPPYALKEPQSPHSTLLKHFLPIVLPLLIALFISLVRTSTFDDFVQLRTAFFNESNVVVEGSEWEQEFVAAVWPQCEDRKSVV